MLGWSGNTMYCKILLKAKKHAELKWTTKNCDTQQIGDKFRLTCFSATAILVCVRPRRHGDRLRQPSWYCLVRMTSLMNSADALSTTRMYTTQIMNSFTPKCLSHKPGLYNYTVSQKKFPPLNFLSLCQMLTDFQNFCIAGKDMKFATKPIQCYPPHLRHVAALPWEVKNSNFLQIFSRYVRKCKQIAF